MEIFCFLFFLFPLPLSLWWPRATEMQNSSPTFLPTTSLIINPPNRGRAHIKGARSHLRLVQYSITFMMMSPTQATQMAHLWIEWGEEKNKWSITFRHILKHSTEFWKQIYLNGSFKHFYFAFFNANILPIIIFSKKKKARETLSTQLNESE